MKKSTTRSKTKPTTTNETLRSDTEIKQQREHTAPALLVKKASK